MHAHDRTMLARYGFADPDAKLSDHDLACRYLAAPERFEALCKLVVRVPNLMVWSRDHETEFGVGSTEGVDGLCFCGELKRATRDELAMRPGDRFACQSGEPARTAWSANVTEAGPSLTHVELEQPLSKGDGQYKSTVGFLDVVLEGQVDLHGEYRWRRHPVHAVSGETETLPERSWYTRTVDDRHTFAIVIEVKITRVSVGDMLRQLKLYQEFWSTRRRCTYWVLAVAWELTRDEHDALTAEGVTVVRLADGFREFCASPSRRERAEVAVV